MSPRAEERAAAEVAAALVTAALRREPPDGRQRLLRQLMSHAAAGLTLLAGERAASEAAYRIADAMAARRRP